MGKRRRLEQRRQGERQGLWQPPSAYGRRQMYALHRLQNQNIQEIDPESLREKLPWWQQHANQELVNLITEGVKADVALPGHLPSSVHPKSKEEEELAQSIIMEYLSVGAVRELNLSVEPPVPTGHLLPWFVLSKPEGNTTKHRLITD